MNFIKVDINSGSGRGLLSGPRRTTRDYRVFAPSAEFWQPTWAPVTPVKRPPANAFLEWANEQAKGRSMVGMRLAAS